MQLVTLSEDRQADAIKSLVSAIHGTLYEFQDNSETAEMTGVRVVLQILNHARLHDAIVERDALGPQLDELIRDLE